MITFITILKSMTHDEIDEVMTIVVKTHKIRYNTSYNPSTNREQDYLADKNPFLKTSLTPDRIIQLMEAFIELETTHFTWADQIYQTIHGLSTSAKNTGLLTRFYRMSTHSDQYVPLWMHKEHKQIQNRRRKGNPCP